MAKFICLQAGHEGITTGATGAPGEKELNVRIRNRLSQILISKGFVVQLVNANPTQSEINKDFDLFLALHGDADIYGTGGGVIGYIDPAIDSSPESNAESKRIKEIIEGQYFQHSGIVNHPERNNKNITRYYMWARLTAKTPCVLLEMGVVQDAHDKVILADTERVANAIARGICKAFNIPYDPVPPSIDWQKKYNDEVTAHNITKDKLNIAQKKIEAAKAALI
jgi:N-acetylmuramoyl-L-alanine amidase